MRQRGSGTILITTGASSGGNGGPDSDPDRIADEYWALYQDRQKPERF